jgi:hypothetical protein
MIRLFPESGAPSSPAEAKFRPGYALLPEYLQTKGYFRYVSILCNKVCGVCFMRLSHKIHTIYFLLVARVIPRQHDQVF